MGGESSTLRDRVTIYVLRLEDGKYYVGRTRDVNKRYQEHKDGLISPWTKKYKPIEIAEVLVGDPFDEDKYVKKYMNVYGIDNVRGGRYLLEVLNSGERDELKEELLYIHDKCTMCGSPSHFLANCHASVANDVALGHAGVANSQCYRCGRCSHTTVDCPAHYDVEGRIIS